MAGKGQRLNESSLPVAQIDFGKPSTLTEEIQNQGEEIAPKVGVKDTKCQTTNPDTKKGWCQTAEFECMFQENKYQALGKDFIDLDDPFLHRPPLNGSADGCLRHVCPHVT